MSTPLMQQYFKIKENYQDCLLFFHLGDFYASVCKTPRKKSR
jgi:DNA mismatch repair protein MutS